MSASSRAPWPTIALSLLALTALSAAGQEPALDIAIVNGKVFTADASAPWAEAVGVRGDRVVLVGTSAAVRARVGAATQTIDAGGRVVIPGINDAHFHVGARPPAIVLKLTDFEPSFDETAKALQEAARTDTTDRWIFGEIGERVLSDPRFRRGELDRLAPGRKVKLYSWTGHGLLMSSAALRAAGVEDRASDPPGGRFGRAGDGTIDGRLVEYADTAANRRVTDSAGDEAFVQSLGRVATEAVGYGVTTIQAMANAAPAPHVADLIAQAATPIRWRVIRFPIPIRIPADAADDFAAVTPRVPTIRVSGTKWILDGTPVERLAAMNEPYADAPGERGTVNFSPADVEWMLQRALSTGDQPMFHAVGDRAIDLVLQTMQKLGTPEQWQRIRVRIEHGEFLTAARMPLAKRLGIVVVQNPLHTAIGPAVMQARYGAERARAVQPFKSYLTAGVPFAIGSDGPLNPYLNMMFAITDQTRPDEALTREQVISAYTVGAAFAEASEKDKGRLAPGLLADLAILSQDIFVVPPDQLPGTTAVVTMVGGRVVRDAR